VLSVSTISAGSGYQYLTKEVVTGAEDYYVRGVTEIGERPGQWIGSGIQDLGLSGTVRVEQMALMYGQGLHPAATVDDPKSLGAPFRRYKGIEQRLAEARAANPGVDDEQWAKIQHKIRTTGDRSAAAGFDLTFSPPKSWSVLWAAAPDEESRELIWAAHHEGVQAAVDYLEREACFSRVGHNGVRQVDGNGLIGARFDHRQSRNGDPQVHSHLAVLNRVRCIDGQWRALDGREIYGSAAAASGMYDAVRESRWRRPSESCTSSAGRVTPSVRSEGSPMRRSGCSAAADGPSRLPWPRFWLSMSSGTGCRPAMLCGPS